MTRDKGTKRLVRRVMRIRGVSYTSALRELRELPPNTWAAYVRKLEQEGSPLEGVEPDKESEEN